MKFFSRGIAALALVAGLGFASGAAAQSIDLNGGLAIGGGEFEVDSVANSGGLTTGTGNVADRLSFSDTAVLAKGDLSIDSNQNRTNIGFDGNVYAGAASQNMIKLNGANAGTSSSFSAAGAAGTIQYGAGAVNVSGSGSISLP